MARIRCFHFDDEGQPINGGCFKGTSCTYVHPTDPQWHSSITRPFQKKYVGIQRNDQDLKKPKAIRCMYYEDDGTPIKRGCPKLTGFCNFIHPYDPRWPSATPSKNRPGQFGRSIPRSPPKSDADLWNAAPQPQASSSSRGVSGSSIWEDTQPNNNDAVWGSVNTQPQASGSPWGAAVSPSSGAPAPSSWNTPVLSSGWPTADANAMDTSGGWGVPTSENNASMRRDSSTATAGPSTLLPAPLPLPASPMRRPSDSSVRISPSPSLPDTPAVPWSANPLSDFPSRRTSRQSSEAASNVHDPPSMNPTTLPEKEAFAHRFVEKVLIAANWRNRVQEATQQPDCTKRLQRSESYARIGHAAQKRLDTLRQEHMSALQRAQAKFDKSLAVLARFSDAAVALAGVDPASSHRDAETYMAGVRAWAATIEPYVLTLMEQEVAALEALSAPELYDILPPGFEPAVHELKELQAMVDRIVEDASLRPDDKLQAALDSALQAAPNVLIPAVHARQHDAQEAAIKAHLAVLQRQADDVGASITRLAGDVAGLITETGVRQPNREYKQQIAEARAMLEGELGAGQEVLAEVGGWQQAFKRSMEDAFASPLRFADNDVRGETLLQDVVAAELSPLLDGMHRNTVDFLVREHNSLYTALFAAVIPAKLMGDYLQHKADLQSVEVMVAGT